MSDEDWDDPADDDLVDDDPADDDPADDSADEDEVRQRVPRARRRRKRPGRLGLIYSVAAVVLAIVSVATVVVVAMIWSAHRNDVAERDHQDQVKRVAVEWSNSLLNIGADEVDVALNKLREKTTGQLRADFDNKMRPYRENLQKRHARNAGRVEAVAIELRHNDPPPAPGVSPTPDPGPPAGASRTDTVLVIATSIGENPGGKPMASQVQLYLDVSEVDGELLISWWGLFS